MKLPCHVRRNLLCSGLLLVAALFVLPDAPAPALASDKAAKLSADEVVAKHLQALGTPEARSAAKSRVAQGTVAFSELITGNAHLDGRALFRSEGPMLKCVIQFASPQYPGEQFAFDGQNVGVAQIGPEARSMLGGFLAGEPEILREGLWGGELSTAWPLLDTKASGAKLRSEGIKKVDGRDLYVLDYTPRKRNNNGELEIRFYFEPETFHHVLTEYRLTAEPIDAGQATDAAMIVTTVDERFSEFHAVGSLTLPTQWEIEARTEPSQSHGFVWKVVFASIEDNK
jgi:hypothetical protein